MQKESVRQLQQGLVAGSWKQELVGVQLGSETQGWEPAWGRRREEWLGAEATRGHFHLHFHFHLRYAAGG